MIDYEPSNLIPHPQPKTNVPSLMLQIYKIQKFLREHFIKKKEEEK